MIFSIEGQKKRYETEASIKEHIEFIKENCNNIYEINLKDNVFHPAALKPFFSEISNCKNLRKITLSRIFSALPKDIMIECFEIIITNLQPQNLVYLDLSQNAISCNFPAFFIKFLSGLSNLHELKIDNCGLGSVGGKILASALAAIKNKRNLNTIDISTNKLTDSADELGKALESFINLEEIFIPYNNIGRESMLNFLKSFEMHVLTKLDLRDNFIDVDGCKLLGECFVNSGINELRLSDCLIKDDGLKAFVIHANETRNYTRCQGFFGYEENLILDFGFNGITEKGVKHLEDFVADKNVKELRIEGNEIDDEKCLANLIEIVTSKDGVVVYKEEEEHEEIEKEYPVKTRDVEELVKAFEKL